MWKRYINICNSGRAWNGKSLCRCSTKIDGLFWHRPGIFASADSAPRWRGGALCRLAEAKALECRGGCSVQIQHPESMMSEGIEWSQGWKWVHTLRMKSCFVCASTEGVFYNVLHVCLSLSLSLQICRLFLFSAARPCWRVLCVVACCGFKIVLQNAGSFLETKHDRAMKVWSWFWGKVGQTMRNYCIYRRLPSYLLRPFVAGSISVQAKCCLAELEFSDAGTQHTWMMPQADQHREADVSRNDMISNAPKWLEWFAGVPTCSGYKIL